MSGGRALGRTAAQRKEAVSRATRTEPPQLPRAAPGIPRTPPCDPRRTSRRPHLTAQGLRLSYLLWSRTAEAGPEPGAPGAPRPPAPRAPGLESGAQHSSAVGLRLQTGRLLGCGSWPPQQMPPGARSLSPPCSRRPPQGWPCPRDGGQLWPPLEPWTYTRCRAEPVRRAQATPSHPAKPPPQSLRSRGRGRAGPEGHSMTHGPEPRSPEGAAGLAGRGGAAAVASSGSPHGSWKERENICALKRWRRRGGDPHHLPPTAPRGGGTHPGAEQVAARLLDAADKVPSFRLEQKFTPEEGEFRSPVGGGLGRRGPHSWLPSSSARKALGQVPAPPRAGGTC